jgi:hypothetical protein
MSDHTEEMLREALERLAADAETQADYLRQLGTWPSLDELALELDDVAEASSYGRHRRFVPACACYRESSMR